MCLINKYMRCIFTVLMFFVLQSCIYFLLCQNFLRFFFESFLLCAFILCGITVVSLPCTIYFHGSRNERCIIFTALCLLRMPSNKNSEHLQLILFNRTC